MENDLLEAHLAALCRRGGNLRPRREAGDPKGREQDHMVAAGSSGYHGIGRGRCGQGDAIAIGITVA